MPLITGTSNLRKQPSAGIANLAIQPGSKLTYEQDGLIRGRMILKGDVSFLKNVPALWTAHPLEPNALCFTREIEYVKLSQIIATLSYIGISQDPTDFIIEFTGGLNRNPIETNPRFLTSIGGFAGEGNALNGAQFDTATGLFLGFPANAGHNLGGVDG